MNKIILLNGPIGCGKTVLATAIHKRFDCEDARAKDHLHTLTMEFFNVPSSVYWTFYEDRTLKEQPQPEFTIAVEEYNRLAPIIGAKVRVSPRSVMLTIRQAMIYVSECLCKPAFGKDYFGRVRAQYVSRGQNRLFVDDSAGFPEELPELLSSLGEDNVMLIRVRGRGTFDGDSRRYLEDGVVPYTIDIHNEGTLDYFIKRGLSAVEQFVVRYDKPPKANPCNGHAVDDFRLEVQ